MVTPSKGNPDSAVQPFRRVVLFLRNRVKLLVVLLPAIALLAWMAGRQMIEQPAPARFYFSLPSDFDSDLPSDRSASLGGGEGSRVFENPFDDARALGSPDLDLRSGWFSVLLDGPSFPGTGFASDPVRKTTPAVRYVLEELDGEVTHFLFDVGMWRSTFEANNARDTTVERLPEHERNVDFVVMSHPHTFATPMGRPDGGGLTELLSANPDLGLYMPRVEGLTVEQLPGVWREWGLLERATFLDEGFTVLTDRVCLWTSSFREAEITMVRALGLQWTPRETALVIDTPEGLFVHFQCAHFPSKELHDHAVHPVQLLREDLRNSPFAGRPIHSVMTGGCDIPRIGMANGATPTDASTAVLAAMVGDLSHLDRVLLNHCGRWIEGDTSQQAIGVPCSRVWAGQAVSLEP